KNRPHEGQPKPPVNLPWRQLGAGNHHMLQVVIAGAQLPPREINWWLGLGLMGAILGLSLTGYLLPWDQKGYWATQVATSIAGSLPGLGSVIKRIIVGGPEYGNHTLTRFYAL